MTIETSPPTLCIILADGTKTEIQHSGTDLSGSYIYLIPTGAKPLQCADPAFDPNDPYPKGGNHWTVGHRDPAISDCTNCGAFGSLAIQAPPQHRRQTARHASGNGRRFSRPVSPTRIRVPRMLYWSLTRPDGSIAGIYYGTNKLPPWRTDESTVVAEAIYAPKATR
jgi:hypothetical protein